MNKNKIYAFLFTVVIGLVIFLVGFTDNRKLNNEAEVKYQVYLDGEKLGLIQDTSELYNLINNEQAAIKNEYGVEQVYPPKGFEVEKYVSYDNEVTTVENVYNMIKNKKSFTIKGYVITVFSEATEEAESEVLYRINVLDKEIFDKAILNLINSFIGYDRYQNYLNDTQPEIKDVGTIIENMYFKENITIKEAYLSTEDKIYTKVDELTRFLMFGDKSEEKSYVVQKGDTIAKVAEANKLNTTEFLIANPEFTNENNILAIGEKVNVTLVHPIISLVYDMYEVEDNEVKYETETKYDDSKSSSYKVVQTKGVNGIQRVATKKQYTNGIENQGAVVDLDNTYMVKEPVKEVIVRGRKQASYGGNYGTYVDDGTSWAWPTNYPFVLTSPFGWRGGEYHDGLDISGTGFGSPIYAISGGIVRSAGYGGMVGGSAGLNVVIEHPNGYWSIYAHLSATYVNVGDTVSRKQKIGAMGHTGRASGTHLHLGISIGQPYNGGRLIPPLTLWR